MAWKMFEFGGVGALGGGVLGVAVGVGGAISAAAAAPIAGPIIFAGFVGVVVGGVGGVFTGAVTDVLEKDSEVKKKDVKIIEVIKEKDAEVIKLAKEKDAKIAQVNKEKDDLEKEKDTRIANLEKNQADHAEVNKKLSEKLDRVVSSDIGTLYTEVEQQKLINKIFADRINTLENENKELKEAKENLEARVKNLENENAELKTTNSNLMLKNLDLENTIKLKDQEIEKLRNSRIDTIQKLATNVESLIMTSGNQLHFISKAMNSISKSKDGVFNSLEVQQEFLNQNLSKEINKWLPKKNIQLKIQGLILLTEEFIKMEKSDVAKIKSKSYEIFCSSKHILANLADELRGLKEQEFELTEKKPENNRISNDSAVLKLLDEWEVPTEFNVLNFIISEVNQITNNQIAVNS